MLNAVCFLLCHSQTYGFCKEVVSRHFKRLYKSSSTYFSTKSFQNKIYQNSNDAVKDIEDGAKLLIGGFDLCSLPQDLIDALLHYSAKNLTVVSNNAGVDTAGLGLLFKHKKMKRMMTSYTGENRELERQYFNGELEVELIPLGTLAERIRAGGAGIPAFYTPTAVGTLIEKGGVPIKYDKEGEVVIASNPRLLQKFNSKSYILEEAITGDFALIKAWKADTYGNLLFNKSARNLNLVMAKAAKITIVEVEEIVELGEIKPDEVHLPGIFVDRIIEVPKYKNRMEILKVTSSEKVTGLDKQLAAPELRERIIRRAALELKDGMCVYLGVGMPLLAASYISNNTVVLLQSGNGVLGLDPFPSIKEISKENEAVTVIKGASFFGSEDSFAMIRGGCLDLTMLGAMEVAQNGDLANWMVPKKLVIGMGGAMDLVVAPGTKIVICMEHNAKNGNPKILEKCSLPLTGRECVDIIITEKGVFEVNPGKGLMLVEIAENLSLDELKKATGCHFEVSRNLKHIAQISVS